MLRHVLYILSLYFGAYTFCCLWTYFSILKDLLWTYFGLTLDLLWTYFGLTFFKHGAN